MLIDLKCSLNHVSLDSPPYLMDQLGNILASVDIISGLTLGYTYELPANRLILESFGSHELFLAYGFDILKPRRTNRYKSVRYL